MTAQAPVSIRTAAPVFAAQALAALALAALLPTTAALATASPAAQPGDLATLLRQHGLQPVDPPSPATDFQLPTPDGTRIALSDYQGTWVLLTFWATWCGPCRVEMPTLEKLHRQRAADGLTVLGVSVDDRASVVAPFTDRLGLSFPNLWDEEGRAATAYRASSIPLSYIVDPQGRIVAAARGSRDWERLNPLIDALLGSPPAEGGYVAASAPAELPAVLDPPSAEVTLAEARPTAGRPFHLDVRLHWPGHFEEYLPHPPQVHLPEGVEQRGMTASTSSRDGLSIVTYRLELAAREPGRFALDPVELRYTPRGETEPLASRLAGPTVEVAPFTLLGLAPATFAGAAGSALALGALGFLFARRRRRPAAAPGGDPRWEPLRARLDEARALRMQGDPRGALLALAAVEDALAGDEMGEDATRACHLEAVRYGGKVPEAQELDRMERRVARLMAEIAPDPQRQARAELRLREGEA